MEMIVILGIILGSLLVLMGLTCCILGFRPVGVAGGSCAACCQSIIGNVVKGSCFAIMTCLAMRGCFIALIIVGLLTLIGIGIYLMINSEWFQSACTWIKNIPSTVGIKASSQAFIEQLQNYHSWTKKIEDSKNTNKIKGFLQW